MTDPFRSDKNPNKAAVAIDEQVPIISGNIQAIIQNKPLKSYSPGMMGKATGPLMVALGHEHEKVSHTPSLQRCSYQESFNKY